MNTLSINLPNFEGFYGSVLDVSECIDIDSKPGAEDGLMSQEAYDDIDWTATYNNVGRKYLDKWIEQNQEVLTEFGITLVYDKIDSPKYYNFSTDKLVCNASFDSKKLINKVLRAVGSNEEYFECLIKEKFTSYDGFCSFYSNDPEYWLSELINEIDKDNVVFELFLEFITVDTDEREWVPYILESVIELCEYKTPY